MVMFLLMAFVFGFGMAATVLIGQAFGRRDLDGARRVIGTAIGGFLPVAAAIGVLGWIFAPALAPPARHAGRRPCRSRSPICASSSSPCRRS